MFKHAVMVDIGKWDINQQMGNNLVYRSTGIILNKSHAYDYYPQRDVAHPESRLDTFPNNR